VATAALGCARGREGEGARGGNEHEESERASRGTRGVSREVEEASREAGGGESVRTHGEHAPLPTGARRKETEGAAMAG